MDNDIFVIKNNPQPMLEFTCGCCLRTELIKDIPRLREAPLPANWSRFVIDFYGNDEGKLYEKHLCPDCSAKWRGKTREFFTFVDAVEERREE